MHVTMKDRVAVVTGGSKGLGLAMARWIGVGAIELDSVGALRLR